MTMRTCLDCGEPCDGSRCPTHDIKGTATQRGYDAAWDRLSKRARRLQPFCTDCGTTEDLQGDHTPEAWARKAAGKPIRIRDIVIRCGPCNRAAGAARGPSARGMAPHRPAHRPLASQSFSNSRVEGPDLQRLPGRRGVPKRQRVALASLVDLECPTLDENDHRRVVVDGVPVGESDDVSLQDGLSHQRSVP